MILPDPELELYLASLSDEALEDFIASLPEDQAARVTALLPEREDDLVTEYPVSPCPSAHLSRGRCYDYKLFVKIFHTSCIID